jgi:two-component system KDP operon response regulator KdpE
MDTSFSGPRTRVFAVTGEAALHRLLRSILEPRGCKVILGPLGDEQLASSAPIDIVIVDVDSSDLEFTSRVRREFPAAEILAIAREYREADCIAALEIGVDYLPRPFRPHDLAARVRVAELRRFKATGRRRFYRRGQFVIDLFDRSVTLDGAPIALAPSALGILMYLTSKPGRRATFGDILATLGRANTASARSALSMLVFRLRRRIERDPKCPDFLLTDPGVGYRLAPESDNYPNPEACLDCKHFGGVTNLRGKVRRKSDGP